MRPVCLPQHPTVVYLILGMRHEGSRLRQLWLWKEHVRTSPCRAGRLGAPGPGLDRLGARQDRCGRAHVSLSQFLFKTSSIRRLPGSLKAATGNWFERRRLICTLLVFLKRGRSMPGKQSQAVLGAAEVRFARASKRHAYPASRVGGWVREDAWSYRVHREISDAFAGPKVEHRDVGAYAA